MEKYHNILRVDFDNATQVEDLIHQLIAYSKDPMGGGKALTYEQAKNSIDQFGKRPYTQAFLAYVDNQSAGFCACIESFSTFAGQAIINIHDLAVLPEFRGQGLSRKLLQAAEDYAREINACKLTLEVLEGNQQAQHAYKNFGFAGYSLDDKHGCALFWQKSL